VSDRYSDLTPEGCRSGGPYLNLASVGPTLGLESATAPAGAPFSVSPIVGPAAHTNATKPGMARFHSLPSWRFRFWRLVWGALFRGVLPHRLPILILKHER